MQAQGRECLPLTMVAAGWPTARPCTSPATAATTPTASNPASNGSLACAAALLPKYLRRWGRGSGYRGGQGEAHMATCSAPVQPAALLQTVAPPATAAPLPPAPTCPPSS